MTGFNQIERSRRSRGCSQRTFLCSRPEQKGFSPPGAIYIRISTSQQQTDRQAEILMDRSLVKEYINEYIQDIVMYNPSNLWILVIVHFVAGSERWGTIKKGKYGRSQSWQEKIYTGWFTDNDDHLFSYDSETHNITEKITSLVHKTYTFEEFNDIAAARGWMGEFKPYEF